MEEVHIGMKLVEQLLLEILKLKMGRDCISAERWQKVF